MKTTNILKRSMYAAVILLSAAKVQSETAGTYTFVNPCQPFPVASSINGTQGCYGFTVSNAGAVDANSYYTWNFGDGATATGTLVYHCYAAVQTSKVFTVTVTYNSPALCGVLPPEGKTTVTLTPPSQTACAGFNPTVSLSARSVTVWGGVTIPEITYNFNYGDGTGTVNTPTHQYTECGSYIIQIKSWDMNAPQDTCHMYRSVNISCPTKTITGIKKQYSDRSISLFPNPASDKISIRSDEEISAIHVTDITGKGQAMRCLTSGRTKEVNLDGFIPGVYFLRLSFEDGSEKNMKFVIQ